MKNEISLFLRVVREFGILVAMAWWLVDSCSFLETRNFFWLGILSIGAWFGVFGVLLRRAWRSLLKTHVGRMWSRELSITFPRWSAVLLVAVLATQTIGCGYKYIEPGFVGVKVDKYGSQRGVQDYP